MAYAISALNDIVKLADKVVEKKTSRSLTLTLRAKDRIALKSKAETILKKAKIKYADVKKTGSSVPVTEFKIDNFRYVLVWKPMGGGSGAGAAVTKLAESAVCLYTAALIYNKKADLQFLLENKSKISRNIDVDAKYDDVVKWLSQNEDWDKTSIESARLIHKTKKISTSHIAHRGSTFFNSIYKEFSRLLKPMNTLRLAIGSDKWNPGDIWISSIKSIPTFESLSSYNKWIADTTKSGKLFAVSLKKSGNPTIKLIDNKPLDVEFVGIRKPKEPLSSKDIYVDFKENSKPAKGVQFRSFNVGADPQGEIKGVYANHGKIGFGNISFILKKMAGVEIPKMAQLKNKPTEEIMSGIVSSYKQLGFTYSSYATNKDLDKYYLITKYQVLLIALGIKKSKNPTVIVEAMIKYASSRGLSGLFDNSWYYKIS
jgi:hypothetical protein